MFGFVALAFGLMFLSNSLKYNEKTVTDKE